MWLNAESHKRSWCLPIWKCHNKPHLYETPNFHHVHQLQDIMAYFVLYTIIHLQKSVPIMKKLIGCVCSPGQCSMSCFRMSNPSSGILNSSPLCNPKSCGWYIHGMCRGRTIRAWSTQDVYDVMFLPLHSTDGCPHQLGVFCLDMETYWIWVSEKLFT